MTRRPAAASVSPTLHPNAGQGDVSERMLQILTEAARLFAENGYERTSMRDIAAACGTSKALLYHHFSDKDEIFNRITLGFTRELYGFVEEAIPAEGSATDKVRAFMVATAAYFERYRHAWMAGTAAFWNDPALRREGERMIWRDRYEGMLRALLTEGVERGEMREMDVKLAGRLILSALNWMHRWFNPAGPSSATEVAEQYHAMIFGGLTAPPTRNALPASP